MAERGLKIEGQTVCAIVLCYVVWGALTYTIPLVSLWIAIPLTFATVLVATFHSSLQHECTHGHPTRHAAINEALVFLTLGIFIPYRRFRALHLRHHNNAALTDPYDDPESFYLDGTVWDRLPLVVRLVFRFNNTLAGRLTIGPALALLAFWTTEVRHLIAGSRGVRLAWALHAVGLVAVFAWLVWACGWSPLAYMAFVAYPAMGVLMIRTYAEHQAHEVAGHRTVIVERGGLLGFLFLNNHLHFVHHSHPRAPWYDLPRLYRENAERYRVENGGYVFESYAAIARHYLFHAKEPVAHPLWRRG